MAEKTVSVRLIARVGQYASEMNQAAGVTSQFGRNLESSAGRAQGAVTRLGAAAALAGKITLLGIGAAMVVSAKAAIDFESSLTGVAKTTDLAGGALTTFGRQIRDLSLDIPVNVNELNKIAELGGQLGIQTPNLINFTETIAELGVTTNLSSEEAATGLARFMNIMGSSQGDIGRFGSVIVELGNNFATTEQDILNFALRLAPVGQAVGISEAGVMALGTALSSLGITAERGGTALQRIFLDMQDAVQTGGDELQAFAEVAGVTGTEFAETFTRDPVDALIMLAGGLDQIVKSGGNVFETLRDIGVSEQRAIGVALALANGNEILAEAYDLANGQIEENNALHEEAALRFGTTESQIGLVANAFNDLRIEIGNAFLDTGIAKDFLGIMKEFLTIMRDNADTLERFAGVLAVISALGIANFFAGMIGKGLEAVSAFRQAASATTALSTSQQVLRGTSLALNAAFGIAGVAAVVMGAIWLNQARKAQELKSAVDELNAAIEGGVDPIDALTDRFREGLDISSIERIQELTGAPLRDFVEDLVSGGSEAQDVLASLGAGVDEFFQQGRGRPFLVGAMSTEDLAVFNDINNAVEENRDVFDAFTKQELANFVDEFRELNPETELTTEQIREMGRRIQDLHGADLSGWAQGVTSSMNFIDPQMRLAIDRAKQLSDTLDTEANPSFINHLLALENGADVYEQFSGDVSDVVTTFRETIAASFDDISASVRGGIPAWDEYGEAVELNVEKMLAARDQWLEDVRVWAEIQPQLMNEASIDTLSEIDNWSTQEKAAFARLSADRRSFLIDEMNADNEEAAGHIRDIYSTRLPNEIRAALPDLLGALQEIAAEVEADNPGLPAGMAFTEGIKQVVTELSDDPVIQDTLMQLLTNPAMLSNTFGWAMGVGAQISAGLIYELSQIGDRAAATMRAQMEHLKEQTQNTVFVDSPSRWSMWVGEMIGLGLIMGTRKALREGDVGTQMGGDIKQSISRAATMPISSMTSTSSYVTSNTTGNIEFNIPIFNPESKDLNAGVEKARNKINALVPLVERNWRLR